MLLFTSHGLEFDAMLTSGSQIFIRFRGALVFMESNRKIASFLCQFLDAIFSILCNKHDGQV